MEENFQSAVNGTHNGGSMGEQLRLQESQGARGAISARQHHQERPGDGPEVPSAAAVSSPAELVGGRRGGLESHARPQSVGVHAASSQPEEEAEQRIGALRASPPSSTWPGHTDSFSTPVTQLWQGILKTSSPKSSSGSQHRAVQEGLLRGQFHTPPVPSTSAWADVKVPVRLPPGLQRPPQAQCVLRASGPPTQQLDCCTEGPRRHQGEPPLQDHVAWQALWTPGRPHRLELSESPSLHSSFQSPQAALAGQHFHQPQQLGSPLQQRSKSPPREQAAQPAQHVGQPGPLQPRLFSLDSQSPDERHQPPAHGTGQVSAHAEAKAGTRSLLHSVASFQVSASLVQANLNLGAPNAELRSCPAGLRPAYVPQSTQQSPDTPVQATPSLTPSQTDPHFLSWSRCVAPSSLQRLPVEGGRSLAQQLSASPGLFLGQTNPQECRAFPPSPLPVTSGGLSLPLQQLPLFLVQQRLHLIRQQLSSSVPASLKQQALYEHQRSRDVPAEGTVNFSPPYLGVTKSASSETLAEGSEREPELARAPTSGRERKASRPRARRKKRLVGNRAQCVAFKARRPRGVQSGEGRVGGEDPSSGQDAAELGLASQVSSSADAHGQVKEEAVSEERRGNAGVMNDHAANILAAFEDENEAPKDCLGWVRRSVRRSKPSARVRCSECGQRTTECGCEEKRPPPRQRAAAKKRRRLQEDATTCAAVSLDRLPVAVLREEVAREGDGEQRSCSAAASSWGPGGDAASVPSPLSLSCPGTSGGASSGYADTSTLASSPGAKTEPLSERSSCQGDKATARKEEGNDSWAHESTGRQEVVASASTKDRRSSASTTAASHICSALSGVPVPARSRRKTGPAAPARPVGVFSRNSNIARCRLTPNTASRGSSACSAVTRLKASSGRTRIRALKRKNKQQALTNYRNSPAAVGDAEVCTKSPCRRVFSPAFFFLSGLSGLRDLTVCFQSPRAFLQSLGRDAPKTSSCCALPSSSALSSAPFSLGDTPWTLKAEEEQETLLNSLTEAFHKALRQVTQQGTILLTAVGSQALLAAAAVAVARHLQQNEEDDEAKDGRGEVRGKKPPASRKGSRSRQGLALFSEDFPGLLTAGAVSGQKASKLTGSGEARLKHGHDHVSALACNSSGSGKLPPEEGESRLRRSTFRSDDEHSARRDAGPGGFESAMKSEAKHAASQSNDATGARRLNSDDVEESLSAPTNLPAVETTAARFSDMGQRLLSFTDGDTAQAPAGSQMTADDSPTASSRGAASSCRRLALAEPGGGEAKQLLDSSLAAREDDVGPRKADAQTKGNDSVPEESQTQSPSVVDERTSSMAPSGEQDFEAHIGAALRGTQDVFPEKEQLRESPFGMQQPLSSPVAGSKREAKTGVRLAACGFGSEGLDRSRSRDRGPRERDKVKKQEPTEGWKEAASAFCVLCAERQTGTPEELLERPRPNEEVRFPCAVAFCRVPALLHEGSPTSSATTSTTRHAILAISWCGANSGSRELLRAVLIGAGCSLFACTDVEGFYFCRSNGLFSETLRTILAPHAYLPRLLGRDDERKLFEGGVPGAAKGDGETALMENGEDGHQFVWGALRECGGATCAPPFSKKQRTAWRALFEKRTPRASDSRRLPTAIAIASASSEGQWLYVSRAAWLRQACGIQRRLHFAPGIEHASLRSCQLLRDGVELVTNVLTAKAVASLYSMIMRHFELLMDRVLPMHRDWPFSPPNSSLFKYNGIACRNSTMRVDVNLSEAHWEWGEGELRRHHLEVQRQVLFLTRLAGAHVARRFGTWRRASLHAGNGCPSLRTSAGGSSNTEEPASRGLGDVGEGLTARATSCGSTGPACAGRESSFLVNGRNQTEDGHESRGNCGETSDGGVPDEGVWRAITFGYIVSIGPHSNDQKVHHDYHQEAYERNILNAFFPLVDITPENSATTFLICGKKLLSCAGAGDMILMDNIVRHYGSSHVAPTIRPLIYCSLADRRTTDTREPVGKKTHFYNWHQYPPLPAPSRSTTPEATRGASRPGEAIKAKCQHGISETSRSSQEQKRSSSMEREACEEMPGNDGGQERPIQESRDARVGAGRFEEQASPAAGTGMVSGEKHPSELSSFSDRVLGDERRAEEDGEPGKSSSLSLNHGEVLGRNATCRLGPGCGDHRALNLAEESGPFPHTQEVAGVLEGSINIDGAHRSKEKREALFREAREGHSAHSGGQECEEADWIQTKDAGQCGRRSFVPGEPSVSAGSEGDPSLNEGHTMGPDISEGETQCSSLSALTPSRETEGLEEQTASSLPSGGLEKIRSFSQEEEQNTDCERNKQGSNAATGPEQDDLSIGKERKSPVPGAESVRLCSEVSAESRSSSGDCKSHLLPPKEAQTKEVSRVFASCRGDSDGVSKEPEGQHVGREKSVAKPSDSDGRRPVAHVALAEQSTADLPLYLRHIVLYRRHLASGGGASTKKFGHLSKS